jgi:ATP-dependent Clp protease ATP-binding subunit ClpB
MSTKKHGVGTTRREKLAAAGYDPVSGVPPLERAIQRLLQDPLATALIRGEFGEGDTILAVAGVGDELIFREKAAAAPVAAGAGR